MFGLITNPGRRFQSSSAARHGYKTVTGTVLALRRRRRWNLRAQLPTPPVTARLDPALGYRILDPETAQATWPSVRAAVKFCEDLIASGVESKKRSKSYMRPMMGDQECARVPELLRFCLEPALLAVVADYLGELPVLSSIKLLHSTPSGEVETGSQLYHCDHDDLRQVKVFIHVSDVDTASGPLTFLPAEVSARVKAEKGYRYGGKAGHLPDDQIRSPLVDEREVVLLGSRGTVALLDTTSNFHFGSRVATRDRHVVIIQYVTPTSFLLNPWTQLLPRSVLEGTRYDLPYAGLVRSDLSIVQNAVLNGRA